MLQIKKLTKQFTKKDKKTGEVTKVGVRDLSFEVKPGRIFGLIGANGAGKTTTMRVLANLTNQDSGEILFHGDNIHQLPNIKSMIAYVSSETQVYDRFSPAQIFNYFGKLAGLSHSELQEKIERLSEDLEMQEYLNLPCGEFSTGMKQRVSIARALLTDPQILIFDEVTNGLDIFASKKIKEIIRDLEAEQRCIIYSTHIMPDADELCQDVAILHKGSIKEHGELDDLQKRYEVKNTYDLFFELINPNE